MASLKLIFNSLCLVWFSHLTIDFMLGVWPAYKTLANLDLAKAGLIASLSMFIGEGLQILFGYLSDRGHQKKLFTIGIILSCSISLLAFTQNYLLLFVLVLSTFIGSGAFHPAATGMISNWSTKKGMLVTLFASSGMIGAAMSQFIFTKSYQFFNGNTLVFLVPVIPLALWSLWHRFPKVALPENKWNLKESLHSLVPYKAKLIKLYLVQVLTQAILLSLLFLLPDVLRLRGFDDWYSLGGAYFFFVVGEVTFTLIAGLLIDKYNSRMIMIGSVIGSTVTLYLFLLSAPLSLPMTSLILMTLGGFIGLMNPVIVATGSKLVPSHASSTVCALMMGGASCLGGFGIVMVGTLTHVFTEEPLIKALEVIGLLFVISGYLLYRLEYRSNKPLSLQLEAVR